MSQDDSHTDGTETVECTLTGPAREQRTTWAQDHLLDNLRSVERIDGGYALVFEDTGEMLDAVTSFVEKESVCCAHATFEVVYEPPYETVRLDFTGPEGHVELMREGFEAVDGISTPG